MIAQYISQQLFLTNFGINFILYCMSGQNFRYIDFHFPLKILSNRCNDWFMMNIFFVVWWKFNFRKEFIQLFRKRSTRLPETQITGTAAASSDSSKKRTVARNVSWNDAYELRSMTILSKWILSSTFSTSLLWESNLVKIFTVSYFNIKTILW